MTTWGIKMACASYYIIECDDAAHVERCARTSLSDDDYATFSRSFDYIDDVLRHAHAHAARHDVALHICAIANASSRIHTITRIGGN